MVYPRLNEGNISFILIGLIIAKTHFASVEAKYLYELYKVKWQNLPPTHLFS